MTKSTEYSWAELVKKVDPAHSDPKPSYTFNGKQFYSPKKKRNDRSRKS